MEKVRILLIGVCGYGSDYLRELLDNPSLPAEIAGICEIAPNVREHFPELKEQGIPVFSSPEEFYREHNADLAVIATPIHLHYEQVMTCLKSGSNVLVEKPVCATVEEARDMLAAQQETGHFVAVGYQMNYAPGLKRLKQDILAGKFGKPVLMKTIHAVCRGRSYYTRNSWAGKRQVHGHPVNDSPFNNSCAHQFQIITFLLGKSMDTAARLPYVEGELYRADSRVENFDTAAVFARTDEDVPIYFYTSHNLKADLGPIGEYRFEKGTVYLGKDYGNGPSEEYVAEMEDGTTVSYGSNLQFFLMQKLYDAIDCTLHGGHPISTVQCGIPHLEAVRALSAMPVTQIPECYLERVWKQEDEFCCIRNLEDVFLTCYQKELLPSQAGSGWKPAKEKSPTKTAIVTGGSRGIGLAIAKKLGMEGYQVTVFATRPKEEVMEHLRCLDEAGITWHYVQGTLDCREDRKRLIEETVRRFGRIDVLVNNAGVAPLTRNDLLEMTEESYDRVMAINAKGTLFLTQLAAKQMLNQDIIGKKRGTIVNVGSCSAEVSSVNRGEYCISKSALSMITTLFADRLAEDGILVHEVRPGVIRTDMTSKVQEKYDVMIQTGVFPIRRWGTPEDVAQAVAAFCSDQFLYTTGNYLDIDGGFHIRRL